MNTPPLHVWPFSRESDGHDTPQDLEADISRRKKSEKWPVYKRRMNIL